MRANAAPVASHPVSAWGPASIACTVRPGSAAVVTVRRRGSEDGTCGVRSSSRSAARVERSRASCRKAGQVKAGVRLLRAVPVDQQAFLQEERIAIPHHIVLLRKGC